MRRDLTFIPFPLLFRAFICASFGKLLSLDFRLLLGSFLEWIVSLFQMSEMAIWYGLEPLLAADFSWQMCFVFLSSQTIRSGDFTDLQKKKKKKICTSSTKPRCSGGYKFEPNIETHASERKQSSA